MDYGRSGWALQPSAAERCGGDSRRLRGEHAAYDHSVNSANCPGRNAIGGIWGEGHWLGAAARDVRAMGERHQGKRGSRVLQFHGKLKQFSWGTAKIDRRQENNCQKGGNGKSIVFESQT